MSRLDKIIASVPSNKTAALVTGKGVHWEPDKRSETIWQDTPLPVFSIMQPQAIPAGYKCGRLEVIGYGGKRSSAAVYVVRCRCGMYGYRKAKSLRDPEKSMCEQCDYLDQLKKGAIPTEVLDKRREMRKSRT